MRERQSGGPLESDDSISSKVVQYHIIASKSPVSVTACNAGNNVMDSGVAACRLLRVPLSD